MNTITELEQAIEELSLEELSRLEHSIHALYRKRKVAMPYDDRYGTISEEDLLLEADSAFLAYDQAEADLNNG